MSLKLLVILCLANGFVSSSQDLPCEIKDITCIDNLINTVAPKILSGSEELEVAPSDPMIVELIEGNLSILKFKFFNSTLTGYKNCKVENLIVDESISKVHYDYRCPEVKLTGTYEIKGKLVIIPVEGRGDFSMASGKYLLHVDSDLKKVEKNGKTFVTIKNFHLVCEALTGLRFDFKNLFNGQKELSDAVHKFAHENWHEVAELVQDPVWNAGFKGMITNVNKYLKQVPLEDLAMI